MGITVDIFATLVVLILIVEMVSQVDGGECCKAHSYFLFGSTQSNKRMWCDNYCCDLGNGYGCCDDIHMSAGSSETLPNCPENPNFEPEGTSGGFTVVIVLSIVGGIAACVGFGICCYKGCCCGQGKVTVTNSTNQANNMAVPSIPQPISAGVIPAANTVTPLNSQPCNNGNPSAINVTPLNYQPGYTTNPLTNTVAPLNSQPYNNSNLTTKTIDSSEQNQPPSYEESAMLVSK